MKLNKMGSAKVAFLLFIPFFLIFGAIATDTGISIYQNKKLRNDTEEIITQVVERTDLNYTDYESEIKRLYERYNYKTDVLVVMADDTKVYVSNERKYSGIFSSMFYKSKVENQVEKKLFGVPFRISQNSKALIKIEAKYENNKVISFEEVE